MIAALLTLALTHGMNVITFNAQPVDRHQVAARYTSGCGGAAASGPQCKQLQWQLEQILYNDLRAGAAATHDTLRIAAAADVPLLAALGLSRLGEGYTAADEPIVVAQSESPFPGVRRAAFDLAAARAIDRLQRLRPRLRAGALLSFPLADEIPGADRLGAPVYPGAAYRPFASDAHRAFFSTDDAPDKVAAFYSAAGRKVLTLEQLKGEQARRAAQLRAVSKDPMAMVRAMQDAIRAGQDPQKVAMAMTAGLGGADKDWGQGLAAEEGVVAPRFVVLDDALQRMLLLFRDALLGKTALVFVDIPSAADLATQRLMTSTRPADRERVQRHARALELLAQPLADDK